jgi:hypothetical protein
MSEGEIQGKEQNELTEQERRAKDLFFQSFRFSQGNTTLQSDLLKWLVVKGYFDNYEIPDRTPDFIKEIAVPKKHKFVEDDKVQELGKMWSILRFTNTRYTKQTTSEGELLPSILRDMVDRDRMYQDQKRPNRQIAEEITPDSNNDPHASFVRKYVINGHPTGSDAFDELHRNLTPLLTKSRTAPYVGPKHNLDKDILLSLSTGWEKNHPGHTFFPPKE